MKRFALTTLAFSCVFFNHLVAYEECDICEAEVDSCMVERAYDRLQQRGGYEDSLIRDYPDEPEDRYSWPSRLESDFYDDFVR